MNLSATLQAQPKYLLFAEALALTLLIGTVDYITASEWTLFVFYGVPILLVVWYGDRRSALIIAGLCGIVWLLANFYSHPYRTTHGYVWAWINRLAYFASVAVGGAALKSQREEIRARMEAMMRTRELEQEIVRVSEREQMRIGQDLHDGLCQNLVAIGCAAACLRADLESRSLPEAEAARGIQKMLKAAVYEARNLARGIFPIQMDAEGLPAALEELVATTNRVRHTSARLETSGDMQIHDPQTAMHVYRIAQEALNNAARHSGSSEIVIRLSREAQVFTMTVSDSGCGFSPEQVSSKGMGLHTIRYRARQIGAMLDMKTQPSGGTIIRCSFIPDHDPGSQL